MRKVYTFSSFIPTFNSSHGLQESKRKRNFTHNLCDRMLESTTTTREIQWKNRDSRGPKFVGRRQFDVGVLLRQFVIFVDVGCRVVAVAGHGWDLVLLLEIQHGRGRHRERVLAVGPPVALHALHLHLHGSNPLVYLRIGALGAALQGLRRLRRRLLCPQLLLLLRVPLTRRHVARLLLLRALLNTARILLPPASSPAKSNNFRPFSSFPRVEEFHFATNLIELQLMERVKFGYFWFLLLNFSQEKELFILDKSWDLKSIFKVA